MDVAEVFNLALKRHQAGQLAEAETLYRQAIALRPDLAPTHNNLGSLLCQMGRFAEAIDCFRQSLALRPSAEVSNNLAAALRAVGEVDQAIAVWQAGLSLAGNNIELLGNLGSALIEKRRFAEAIEICRRAVSVRGDLAVARYNLGLALELGGRRNEAIAEYRQAIALEPRFARGYSNLGGILQALGQTEEAIAACRSAIELDAGLAEAHNNLGAAYFNTGLIDAAVLSYRKAVELAPARSDMASNLLFTLYYDPGCDFSKVLPQFQDWNRRFAAAVKTFTHKKPAGRKGGRLRIGYVSPNLRAHAEGAFILPLLEHHDHQKFEILCYSDATRADAVTRRMQRCADTWRETAALDPAALAARIYGDRVDILIDLTMHMAGHRLEALAQRPAPIQVAYLAYPGTTGLAVMDYRLTDSFVDPPELFADHYTERCFRLPRTFACYDPAGMDGENADRRCDEIDPGPPPALGNGFITFGCLNNCSKVNGPVLARWAGVLKATPTARLRVLVPEGEARERMLQVLAGEGVEAGRIEFVGKRSRSEYMAEFRRIDISLDTLPYCGHTTSLDSIWMGVPVVTRIGSSAAGRVGWSIANNLGLTELAGESDAQFAQIAAALAGDLPRLRELRRTLRARLLASPIMDGAAFARDVEAAYGQMWERWIAS